jgi:hypothetical protein
MVIWRPGIVCMWVALRTIRFDVKKLRVFPNESVHIFCVDLRTHSIKSLVLGAFAKLRKATISSVMYICPSVRMEQPGSQWKNFHEM